MIRVGTIDAGASSEVVMRRLRWIILSASVIGVVACSAAPPASHFKNGEDDQTGDDGTNGTGTFGNGSSSGSSGAPTGACVPDKGNYDIPGNNCDDDGDGKVDNPPTCDAQIGQAATAFDFARALGICADASKDGYGLVSAKFTRGYQRTDAPNAAQHGVLPKFGNVIKPREGGRLGVLSSGYAEEFDGPGNAAFGLSMSYGNQGVDWNNARANPGNGTLPPGFPKAAAGCPQAPDVNDMVDLVLELKAPANATGLAFDFDFYSSEWPAYICSRFNDGFIAYLSAKGFNGGKPDNISFDKDKNPVSVNNGFFDRCTAGVETGCAPGAARKISQCPGGVAELGGTGFGMAGQWCGEFDGTGGSSVNGGATGWLSSQASISPGETFTLELMIWDTGDGDLDSSVLVDNFRWLGGTVTTGTVRPPR
jgi:hypothetical protein